MNQLEIEAFVNNFADVQRQENMGYTFFFVGDNHYVPFVSIASQDNPGDVLSHLNRDGLFRVNIGVSKATFESLFANFDTSSINYAALDTFMPHPDYAPQFYLCILNPSPQHDSMVKQLIIEAHQIASKKQKNTTK